jgi:hypothetical protein
MVEFGEIYFILTTPRKELVFCNIKSQIPDLFKEKMTGSSSE